MTDATAASARSALARARAAARRFTWARSRRLARSLAEAASALSRVATAV